MAPSTTVCETIIGTLGKAARRWVVLGFWTLWAWGLEDSKGTTFQRLCSVCLVLEPKETKGISIHLQLNLHSRCVAKEMKEGVRI